MAALFKVIGSSHGVPEEQIRRSLGHRRIDLDLAVILCFAVLYGCVANVIARRPFAEERSEYIHFLYFSAAWAAANLAIGTRKGEQLT